MIHQLPGHSVALYYRSNTDEGRTGEWEHSETLTNYE